MLCTLPPDRTTKLDGLFGSLSVSAVPEAQTDLMLSACLLATAFLRSHIARWHGGPCVEAKGCTQTGQGRRDRFAPEGPIVRARARTLIDSLVCVLKAVGVRPLDETKEHRARTRASPTLICLELERGALIHLRSLQHSKEGQQIFLLLRTQLQFQDQVEKLHRVLQFPNPSNRRAQTGTNRSVQCGETSESPLIRS